MAIKSKVFLYKQAQNKRYVTEKLKYLGMLLEWYLKVLEQKS